MKELMLIEPSFFDNNCVIFNYLVRKEIEELFNSVVPVKHPDFSIANLSKKCYITKITNPNASLYRAYDDEIVKPYLYDIGQAFKNGGIFAKFYGNNSFTFVEEFPEDIQTRLLTAMQNGMRTFKDKSKQEIESKIPVMIPLLKKWVDENHQVKKEDFNWLDDDLIGFCDSDFYAYMFNDKFMISCSASATLYMVDFTDDGFVIYGENNDYGSNIEEKNDPDFDSDNVIYDVPFQKHLTPTRIIFEYKNGVGVALNPIISMFDTIVTHILTSVNLWEDD